jgi:hypothetical protein
MLDEIILVYFIIGYWISLHHLLVAITILHFHYVLINDYWLVYYIYNIDLVKNTFWLLVNFKFYCVCPHLSSLLQESKSNNLRSWSLYVTSNV